ncbi:hypothetical protein AWENTII_012493 [Aspergillus wentii]
MNASRHPQPNWEKIPSAILIHILAQCDLFDIYALSLTCHLLHRQITKHEYAIAKEYLHRRQQQRQDEHDNDPPPLIEDLLSPGDDLTFISYLFPPPPPHYVNGASLRDDQPEYSFAYLADLNRCWTTCIKLSYYLAEHTVRHHLETDATARTSWASSKTEKEFAYSKGVELLQAKLLHPMAYLIFFLETNASMTPPPSSPSTSNHAQAQETPIQTQQSILQQCPFTNPHILLSTHHCMRHLTKIVRHLMAPEISYASTENWLSLLLTTSTLERILGFFTAIAEDEVCEEQTGHGHGHGHAHTHTWSRRMEFMWQMRGDWDEVMADVGDGIGERIAAMPGLREVWFEAAEREIQDRGLVPHDCEDVVPILHGSVVVLNCDYCEQEGVCSQ